MPDPDLEIRGRWSFRPLDTGEGMVSTIWASVWSTRAGGGGGGLRAPPLNPPVNSNNIYKIYIDKYTNCSPVGTFHFVS